MLMTYEGFSEKIMEVCSDLIEKDYIEGIEGFISDDWFIDDADSLDFGIEIAYVDGVKQKIFYSLTSIKGHDKFKKLANLELRILRDLRNLPDYNEDLSGLLFE